MNLTRRQLFKRTAQVTAAAVVAPMVAAEAMAQEPVSAFSTAPAVPIDGHVNKPSSAMAFHTVWKGCYSSLGS